jgi:hypothetical protein
MIDVPASVPAANTAVVGAQRARHVSIANAPPRRLAPAFSFDPGSKNWSSQRGWFPAAEANMPREA